MNFDFYKYYAITGNSLNIQIQQIRNTLAHCLQKILTGVAVPIKPLTNDIACTD